MQNLYLSFVLKLSQGKYDFARLYFVNIELLRRGSTKQGNKNTMPAGNVRKYTSINIAPMQQQEHGPGLYPFFLLCFILFSCYPFIPFFKASRFRIDYRKRLVKIWDTARWSLERGRSHVNRFDNKCTWSLYLVIIINALKHLLNFKVIPDCHSFYIFLLCCSLTTYFFFF